MLRKITGSVAKTLCQQQKQQFQSTGQLKNEISKFNDSFLAGCNAEFVEVLFNRWADNPSSVAPSWDLYFKNLVRGVEPEFAFSLPPSDLTKGMHMAPDHAMKFVVSNNLKARLLVDTYRIRGHEKADLDPLCKIN